MENVNFSLFSLIKIALFDTETATDGDERRMDEKKRITYRLVAVNYYDASHLTHLPFSLSLARSLFISFFPLNFSTAQDVIDSGCTCAHVYS